MLSAAAIYSWRELSGTARDLLLARVQEGVQSATVQIEELVEALAEAATVAAGRLGPAGAARTPAAALALLWQLQRNLSGQALKVFQVMPC